MSLLKSLFIIYVLWCSLFDSIIANFLCLFCSQPHKWHIKLKHIASTKFIFGFLKVSRKSRLAKILSKLFFATIVKTRVESRKLKQENSLLYVSRFKRDRCSMQVINWIIKLRMFSSLTGFGVKLERREEENICFHHLRQLNWIRRKLRKKINNFVCIFSFQFK